MKAVGVETIQIKDCTWKIRDKGFAGFLLSSPLSFSSLLSQPPNQCMKKGKKKALWEIKTTQPGGKVYLVKVYRNTRLMSRLKSLFTCSKALKEFQTAQEIAEHHIPTFLPVAAGEVKKNGLIRESYIVIEKIEGCTDLGKYLLRDGEKIGSQEKTKTILHLVQLIRNLHEQGIHQIDLALNNFLIKTKHQEEPRIFFSDFEKVKFLPAVSESLRYVSLAKLNRVGKEISFPDRLRFLKAYLGPGSGDRKKFRATARYLQHLTLETLKRDGQRRRMTSVYTDCYYKTHRDKRFHGYCRDGYMAEDLLKAVRDWGMNSKGEIHAGILFQGNPATMKIKRYPHPAGSQVWSNAFTLSLGTLPVFLPHAFFTEAETGAEFVFFPVEDKTLTLKEFLSGSETQGIAKLCSLLFALHRFGSFSSKISEGTFSFSVHDNTVTPSLIDINSFSMKKEVTQEDRERDLSSFIALLSSHREQRDIEQMVRSCYNKKADKLLKTRLLEKIS